MTHLGSKDFCFLALVKATKVDQMGCHYWKKAKELELHVPFIEEWNMFLIGLQSRGIQLIYEVDVVIWSWIVQNGMVNAKLTYEAIFCTSQVMDYKWWNSLL